MSVLMVDRQVIRTERRADDWRAWLVERPAVWEAGRTEAEAVGKLIESVAERLS